ncbi:arginyltransferase 1 isoform X2 [Nomia melanderi]|uniref:arginyltransferase 1 isoform X2 n=1 Tax=Nomia melanderi TaxID=2448451 RepID=UPI0013046446|nr:arginyl-tRNA--protein transferase 1 isoform X2 [Nomia melanderi]
MARQSYSIVRYYGGETKGRCGYCKNSDSSFSHGMQAIILEVQDYQALIDRGWRRSGCYCYKPTMDQTCCPTYTIKCEALNFKITKSQKKILKRMGKFLRNELQKDDLMDTSEGERDNIDIVHIPHLDENLRRTEEDTLDIKVKGVEDEVNIRLQSSSSDKSTGSSSGMQQKQTESISCTANQNEKSQATSRSLESVEMIPSRIPCKKAKLLRIERKQNKLLAQGKTQAEIDAMFKTENKQQNQGKSIEELFDEMLMGTDRLKINLIRVKSDEFFESFDASADLYKKYQMAVHGESAEECDKELFLYFFVRHPLEQWTAEHGPPCGYGAFHEQYWLDNELIAVGVIDILPSCVSSVYFFYDPAYSFLSLGTFSSLREVYLTRQLNKTAKDLQYYYMGFYIHSCPKMRYKARLKPSKLLCPETYEWFDIDACIKKLDKEKYCRFNEDLDVIDQDAIVDINKVLVLFRQTAMPFRIYKERSQWSVTKDEEEEIEKYASLVGMKCAQRMLLYRL